MSKRTIRTIIEGQQPVTADTDMTAAEAARVMRERQVGAILVLEAGRLAGIFTERDALFRIVAEGLDPTTTPIASAMTPDPTTIHPDKDFDKALEMMHSGHFRHLPVVEDGSLLGMVSSLDAMGPELEQFMYAVIVDEQKRDILL
ncbi:MAG: CBS domain-containing protein [Gammaproteobacteria bacterium]